MLSIFDYKTACFVDIFVNGISILQIDYAQIEYDENTERIYLYNSEGVEFSSIRCDEYIII